MVCPSYAHARSKGAIIGCVDFCQPSSTHTSTGEKPGKQYHCLAVSEILVIKYKQVHSQNVI